MKIFYCLLPLLFARLNIFCLAVSVNQFSQRLIGALSIKADLGLLEQIPSEFTAFNISLALDLIEEAIQNNVLNQDIKIAFSPGVGTVILHHCFNLLYGHRESTEISFKLQEIIFNALDLLPSDENVLSSEYLIGDIKNVYWKDPPLIFKSFALRQISLMKHLIEFTASIDSVAKGSEESACLTNSFSNLLSDKKQETWIYKIWNDMYSILSEEVVPLAKLLLHAKAILKQSNAPTIEMATNLLQSATLARSGKPVISPKELFYHSSTFMTTVLPFVASVGSSDNTTVGVELVDIMSSLGDVIQSTIQGPILNHAMNLLSNSNTAVLGKETAERIVYFLTTSVTRSPLHALFLAGPGASSLFAGITKFVSALESFSRDNNYHDWLSEIKKKLSDGIFGASSVDARGHSPFSYYLDRWARSAESSTNSQAVRSLSDSLGVDYDLEVLLYHGKAPYPSEKLFPKHGEQETQDEEKDFDDDYDGGWNPARLNLGDKISDSRCDILEVWSNNNSLPSIDEFFSRFVNTATPVIFRFNETAERHHRAILDQLKGRAKLRFKQPRIESVRQTFRKENLLQKFGQVTVPVAVIPYAGKEAFSF